MMIPRPTSATPVAPEAPPGVGPEAERLGLLLDDLFGELLGAARVDGVGLGDPRRAIGVSFFRRLVVPVWH